MALNGINSQLPQMSGTPTEGMGDTLGLNKDQKEIIKDAVKIFSGLNLKITNPNAGGADKTDGRKTDGATETPSIDNPADLKQVEQNLERLLAYLQLDNDQRQAEMAKDRINILKDKLETERGERSEKINKSIEDMDKAEKSRKKSKIFGWLMTALAVVAAVVACIATGGLAVGAVAGAAVALTVQILNETEVMDKLTEKLEKALTNAGCSKLAAKVLAAVIITAAILAASGVAGFASGGASALSNTVNSTAKTIEAVRAGITIAQMELGLVSLANSMQNVKLNYDAGKSQAEATETQKFLVQMQQVMEEAEEELQQILNQIQSSIGQIVELLASASDTSAEIANNIGQMA